MDYASILETSGGHGNSQCSESRKRHTPMSIRHNAAMVSCARNFRDGRHFFGEEIDYAKRDPSKSNQRGAKRNFRSSKLSSYVNILIVGLRESSGWNFRRFQRKSKGEHGALSQLAGNFYGTAMRFDNRFRDRQAHSGALYRIAIVFAAKELVED